MKSIKIVALIFLVCVSFALLLSFASAAVLSVHSSQCTYCAEKGDMNGDGKVGLDDAIYLLQHVLMPELFPVSKAVDFDGNGSLSVDDAIYLLQHVLMPGLFPLN